MKFLKSFFHALRDLFLHLFPVHLHKCTYRYGFLIHSRDEKDVITKYPIVKYVPYPIIRFFLKWYWPVTVTKRYLTPPFASRADVLS